jgi:hypothetical protein
MRRLLYLLIICGAAYMGYRYMSRSGSINLFSAVDPATGKPLVKCYRCQGAGSIKCTARGCKDGWVDCPGPCLKLSVGRWEHLDVPGHDPKELWQKFTYSDGWHAWTTGHIGEVIEMRGGKPTNVGKCPVCKGKGKVPCKVCKGTGQVVCDVCGGKKLIPVSLVTTPPIKTNNGAIKLKDGTTVFGKIVIIDSDTVWIRKTDGHTIQIPQSNLLEPAVFK